MLRVLPLRASPLKNIVENMLSPTFLFPSWSCPPEPSLLAGVVAQCLLALEYLHEANLVHRDIKSDNILLNASGQVKIGVCGNSCCVSLVYTHTCLSVCVVVPICACLCECSYSCVCICVCVHVYMCVVVCVHTYMYDYTQVCVVCVCMSA